MHNTDKLKIAVIGLGYVGLPLAEALCSKYNVTGYDTSEQRVAELNAGLDVTHEADTANIMACIKKGELLITDNNQMLAGTDVFIITVPTPLTEFKTPDLSYVINASHTVARYLNKGGVVIYESTVYPGCTEEICVPVLAKVSGLEYNKDFYCGYSPERINPGDKVRTLTTIKKITSGSTPEAAEFIDRLYAQIIKAGTYRAPSIMVAEAAKAIENAQRDVNISFINELALICDRLNIDTNDVIDAAATKWNFLPFRPGLVGGHCIGVDPYYLVHKAEATGYYPQVILSGRRVNDTMGIFVANKLVKLLIANGYAVKGSRVLILGIAFKENCPDIRNTRVVDIYNELRQFGLEVDIYDSLANPQQVKNEYNIAMAETCELDNYAAVVIAVAHDYIKNIDFSKCRERGIIVFDTKACINRQYVDARL